VAKYLLDTNILHQLIKAAPSPTLAAWFDAQPSEDFYICSMNLTEIWNSMLETVASGKRSDEGSWLTEPRGRRLIFGKRALTFDEKAGAIWAKLIAERGNLGLPCAPVDMIFAAIAEANDCVLVTEDEERFKGLKVLHPMRTIPTSRADLTL
jgi:toxin FitB